MSRPHWELSVLHSFLLVGMRTYPRSLGQKMAAPQLKANSARAGSGLRLYLSEPPWLSDIERYCRSVHASTLVTFHPCRLYCKTLRKCLLCAGPCINKWHLEFLIARHVKSRRDQAIVLLSALMDLLFPHLYPLSCFLLGLSMCPSAPP